MSLFRQFHGEVQHRTSAAWAPAGAVVATDPASVDADYDNGAAV
jgi:hypothetical protein